MRERFADKTWTAGSSAVGYDNHHLGDSLSNDFDRIDGVGPCSCQELLDDIKLAEKEMGDMTQWSSLNSFLDGFKQSHAAWFK